MAAMARKKCLILTGNTCIGYQIATQLERCGWRVRVTHSDVNAYDRILREHMDVVVADIDTEDLGGLAILAYCHRHDPSISTCAVTAADDAYRNKLARDIGGCRGFFYLINGGLKIDSSRGMAAALAAGFSAQPHDRDSYSNVLKNRRYRAFAETHIQAEN